MKFIYWFKFPFAIVAGVATGLMVSIFIFHSIKNVTSTDIDGWQHNANVGSENASALSRTVISIMGFLGLSREETLYFFTDLDADGEPLDGACDYTVNGRITSDHARWWSMTAYNSKTQKLIVHSQDRYSYTGDTVAFNEDGSFSINIGASKQQGNWIPVSEKTSFDLLLRLYNPSLLVTEQTETLVLPKIIKGQCHEV